MTRPAPAQPPRNAFPIATPAFHPGSPPLDTLTISWVGHSTLLIQIGGLNILTDPVWSDRASPLSFAGPTRWMPPAIRFENLPPLDVVLLSHNHYDHLDTVTLKRVVRAYPRLAWVVPLGLAEIARRCGASNITELDWWQETRVSGVQLTCAPAQHFSGRGLHDHDRTLWCSWAIRAAESSMYFGADSGLHSSFAEIGARCGPFDVVALPIGAYEPRWFMRPVHMNPEDAIQAYLAISSASTAPGPAMVPIHWGTFKLTDEPMDEPPVRARDAWAASGLPHDALWLMAHGETRQLRARS